MKFFKDTNLVIDPRYPIGGKAENLRRLVQAGFEVPRWIVIPATELVNRLPFDYGTMDGDQQIRFVHDADIPAYALQEIADYFPDNFFLAVRSSAVGEDGADHSFAGLFESYLYVAKDELETHIKRVWASLFGDRVAAYARQHGIDPVRRLAVVIQAMVPAEVSGVAFGANPVSGNRKERVVNAVYGLGEGLVSGQLNADQYIVKGGGVTAELAEKTHRVVRDWQGGRGTLTEEVEPRLRNVPALTERQVRDVTKLLDRGASEYGYPLDIEFAWADDVLYVLQARPITRLPRYVDRAGAYTLWDNSNIIESYPGVTTPLTFSFVSKSYASAYRLFCGYLGVPGRTLDRHAQVFANTLGLIDGRIYYNLKTWYHMLALLPGYRINARYMEQMMGVKERFDIPDSYRLSWLSAWWAIVSMAGRMLWRFIRLPVVRRRFKRLLDETIGHYQQLDLRGHDAAGLIGLYQAFERKLLNEWKAPLLNDFFAMIAFGTLEKRVKKLVGDAYPNLHNDLLCGSADIISTQPIHRCLAIAGEIGQADRLRDLFLHADPQTIWRKLQADGDGAAKELKRQIDGYLADFGERCVGELKLETVSYTQDPSRFIQLLQSYVKGGMDRNAVSNEVEERLRADAEAVIDERLKGKALRRWAFGWLLRQTRTLVSARENLRYERTRAFGMVRRLMMQLGNALSDDGLIHEPRDVFYLTMDELSAYIDGRAVSAGLKPLIALRREEFAGYQASEVPPERFATYGVVYAQDRHSAATAEAPLAGDLKGIGCCPGRVRAKVRVVLDPLETGALAGDILVTRSTDPGWTTLFPSASGILVERGSLLSHSAIVSREMGKPCIVGITGLLKVLKTGDWVEMDGSTGVIKRIESHGHD